jgi:hypothetical protein
LIAIAAAVIIDGGGLDGGERHGAGAKRLAEDS